MMTRRTALLTVSAAPAALLTACRVDSPTDEIPPISTERLAALHDSIASKFAILRPQTIRPARSFLAHDYLVPGDAYDESRDWDGFFIGCHLSAMGKPEYLREWVLNFVEAIDYQGYVSGCLTPEGPKSFLGTFAVKPFLAQGAWLSSKALDDYSWLASVWDGLALVSSYREKTQYDEWAELFYWDNAVQSGAENNPVLTNDDRRRGSILATDINTFQYREYLAMAAIAGRLGKHSDAGRYAEKARLLRAALLGNLWDNDRQSLFNMHRTDGRDIRRIPRVSYSNFVPLIQSDLLPNHAGREMIRRYLWNEEHLLSPYGLRSLSRQDPDYNNVNTIEPYRNWQGPIWIAANYLYFIALKNYGFEQECRQLAFNLGTLLAKDIDECGSMHENYDGESGAPLFPTAEQPGDQDGDGDGDVEFSGFVGWNLLVENMLQAVVEDKWMLLEID